MRYLCLLALLVIGCAQSTYKPAPSLVQSQDVGLFLMYAYEWQHFDGSKATLGAPGDWGRVVPDGAVLIQTGLGPHRLDAGVMNTSREVSGLVSLYVTVPEGVTMAASGNWHLTEPHVAVHGFTGVQGKTPSWGATPLMLTFPAPGRYLIHWAIKLTGQATQAGTFTAEIQ